MALTKREDEYHPSMRRHQGHAGPLQGPGAVPQTHRQVEYICSATPVKKVLGQDLQLVLGDARGVHHAPDLGSAEEVRCPRHSKVTGGVVDMKVLKS